MRGKERLLLWQVRPTKMSYKKVWRSAKSGNKSVQKKRRQRWGNETLHFCKPAKAKLKRLFFFLFYKFLYPFLYFHCLNLFLFLFLFIILSPFETGFYFQRKLTKNGDVPPLKKRKNAIKKANGMQKTTKRGKAAKPQLTTKVKKKIIHNFFYEESIFSLPSTISSFFVCSSQRRIILTSSSQNRAMVEPSLALPPERLAKKLVLFLLLSL